MKTKENDLKLTLGSPCSVIQTIYNIDQVYEFYRSGTGPDKLNYYAENPVVLAYHGLFFLSKKAYA